MLSKPEAIGLVTHRYGVSPADVATAVAIINSGKVVPEVVVAAVAEIESGIAWLYTLEYEAGLPANPVGA